MKNWFSRGAYDGIPIALGYLSVSFGFGIKAVQAGLSPLAATVISAANLTSAGQAAGVDIISACGTLIEMILVQLVINLRYSLMALSLSQNLDRGFTVPHRFAASYGITDEIFAVCSTRKEPVRPAYMYGMIAVAFAGWVTGTALGAAAGQLLPDDIRNALGIMLYGMFIAIIVPPAKKQLSVLLVVLAAAGLSVMFRYLITAVSGGFAMIISAVAAAALGALFFPVKEGEAEGA